MAQTLWHPFADMAWIVAKGEVVLERGDGCYVWDAAGTRYLDATASLWYCNVGWGRSEIGEAVAAQMAELPAYSTFGDFVTPVTLELADRVAGMSPVDGTKVFLTSGGSDSIDTATKMARRYWQLLDEPDRTILIRREKAYHGMHTAGTSLAGIPSNAAGHGQLIEDVVEVPWDDADSLRAAIDDVGPERVAAFFCEPVIGAGGVFPPPDGYLEAARRVCRDTGVLFVADEVITGFGRCGDWFASGRFALDPDIVVCAKGITSGYLPLGAVLASPAVADAFWSDGAGMWRHGYTYSGHAAVAAAALVNIDILEREDLPGRARGMEGTLLDALKQLADHELVDDVRGGVGLLGAISLRPDAVAADPMVAVKAGGETRRAGVLVRPLVGGAIAVSPPLTISEAQLQEMVDGMRAGLDAVR
ncbi:MAG TPA: aminotransferase class III-fold pyridoxal phosphate-dependent enzyme [Actinomycetota bacterium]|nr:aminotransferase class III-fold pyridoxal phosphate-dependent enzyme [Actinomycetota bacterium]